MARKAEIIIRASSNIVDSSQVLCWNHDFQGHMGSQFIEGYAFFHGINVEKSFKIFSRRETIRVWCMFNMKICAENFEDPCKQLLKSTKL